MWPWEAFNWGVFWAVVAAGIVWAILRFLKGFLMGMWDGHHERLEAERALKRDKAFAQYEQKQREGWGRDAKPESKLPD